MCNRLAFRFVAAALVVCVAVAGYAKETNEEKGEDKDIRNVAAFVADAADRLDGNHLAIMPFSYLDGGFSVEGRLISELLHVELANADKVELLERERLDAIVREHELGRMGMLDEGSIAQLGKLTGVNGFVFGRCVDLGHKVQVTVSLVDTKSKVLATKQFLMKKRIKTPTTPLREDIRKIKHKNKETFGIKVWTDETEYRIGDEIVIKFKADRSCYATIFNMGTSGQINVLFPNRFYATNHIRKGTVYSIPGRFQNFAITAQGPAGIEKLKIFATEANVPLLPEQYNVSMFRSLDPEQRSVTRDLAVTIRNLDATAWAEGTFEFRVKPKEPRTEHGTKPNEGR